MDFSLNRKFEGFVVPLFGLGFNIIARFDQWVKCVLMPMATFSMSEETTITTASFIFSFCLWG